MTSTQSPPRNRRNRDRFTVGSSTKTDDGRRVKWTDAKFGLDAGHRSAESSNSHIPADHSGHSPHPSRSRIRYTLVLNIDAIDSSLYTCRASETLKARHAYLRATTTSGKSTSSPSASSTMTSSNKSVVCAGRGFLLMLWMICVMSIDFLSCLFAGAVNEEYRSIDPWESMVRV